MVEERKKKFGKKNVRKKETKEEKKINDDALSKKIEIAEIKSNLWKLYRDRSGNMVRPDTKVIERRRGWKGRKRASKEEKEMKRKEENREDEEWVKEAEKLEHEMNKKIAKYSLLKDSWELMVACLGDVEEEDIDWMEEEEKMKMCYKRRNDYIEEDEETMRTPAKKPRLKQSINQDKDKDIGNPEHDLKQPMIVQHQLEDNEQARDEADLEPGGSWVELVRVEQKASIDQLGVKAGGKVMGRACGASGLVQHIPDNRTVSLLGGGGSTSCSKLAGDKLISQQTKVKVVRPTAQRASDQLIVNQDKKKMINS